MNDYNNEGAIVVNTNNVSTSEDSKLKSEYVDATQVLDFVRETQIDPAHKEVVTNFLQGTRKG